MTTDYNILAKEAIHQAFFYYVPDERYPPDWSDAEWDSVMKECILNIDKITDPKIKSVFAGLTVNNFSLHHIKLDEYRKIFRVDVEELLNAR